MNWYAKIYSYCERGGDPSFWAEPLNAISNGAFIIAGLVAAYQLARQPAAHRAVFEWLLVLLVIVIGIGSFLFHTYATPWAVLADTIPISLFMLAYLGYALPIYSGCANVGDYFPLGSLVRLPDVHDHEGVITTVRGLLRDDPWAARLGDIRLGGEKLDFKSRRKFEGFLFLCR